MKTKKQKEVLLSDLTANLEKAKSIVFTDYQGLTVKEISALRKELKLSNHQYEVIKKTLIAMALKKVGLDETSVEKIGAANGLVIGQDEIAPIKMVFNFIKDHPNMKVSGGFIEQKFYGAEQMLALSRLPGKQELLAQTVMTLKAPLFRLHHALNANLQKLVYILSTVSQKQA
jgi:large subunit ribosomal protein L10